MLKICHKVMKIFLKEKYNSVITIFGRLYR